MAISMHSSLLQLIPDFFSFSPSEADFTCIFTTQKLSRCRRRVNMMDRQRAGSLKEQIATLDPSQDEVEQLLKRYATLCCCLQNHRASFSEQRVLQSLCERWACELKTAYQSTSSFHRFSPIPADTQRADVEVIANIGSISHAMEPTSIKSLPDTRTEVHANKIREVKSESHGRASTQINQISAPKERLGGDCCAGYTNPKSYEERQPAQSPSPSPNPVKLEPYDTIGLPSDCPQTRSKTRSSAWSFQPFPQPRYVTVTNTLLKNLTYDETRPGSIYIFSRPSDPGFLKIGYTIRSVSQRLREWSKSCNYIPELVYSVPDVPNVKKVERLVQLSLGAWRRKETYCKHNRLYCTTSHQEWFEVDVAHARSAICGWTEWMRAPSPYGSEGVLKEEWRVHVLTLQTRAAINTLEALTLRVSGQELEMLRYEPVSGASQQRTSFISAAPARRSIAHEKINSPLHSKPIASSSVEQLAPGVHRLWKRALALTRCTIRMSNVAAPSSPWTIASVLCKDPALVVKHQDKRSARITLRPRNQRTTLSEDWPLVA